MNSFAMTLASQTPSVSLLTLRAGELVLELAPEVGGSIAAFYQLRDDGRFDWLRPATTESLERCEAEGMASFPLVPFCNRIRNGRATFQGREIAMPPNRGHSPHTIHGVGWQQPWVARDVSASHATLALDCAASFWPYRFHATQRFELSEDRLDVTIDVENRDTAPMPLGVGHHPYLPHLAGTLLQTEVERIWTADAEVMPVSLEKSETVERLRRGVLLREVVADNNFVGWNRKAHVMWPGAGRHGGDMGLTLSASSPLDYFVLYSPRGEGHFCIEPVSNCTDWLNLSDYPQSVLGGAVLLSGEASSATFSITVHAQ
jgi:aldose 1-epimerase